VNRNELIDSILKDVDRVEDEDNLEEDGQRYHRPRPPKEPSQVYSVRIPVDRLEQLRRVAEQRHLPPSALLRDWVVQRLDTEAGNPHELSLALGNVTATLSFADDFPISDVAVGDLAESLATLLEGVRRASEQKRTRRSAAPKTDGRAKAIKGSATSHRR
jgi:hypothetical protein